MPATPDSSRLPTGSSARQARAERILDTTAELLALHGYKRVTIDDVAGRAGIGKGTVYLHWKTREALFWAVLGRESMWMLEKLIVELSGETDLALPHRLMRAVFLEVVHRPLVRALLLSDTEVLGNLSKDETVATAQRELAGNKNYLVLLMDLGLLRPGLTVEGAGHILENVMRGFFSAEDGGTGGSLTLEDRADLLADVLRRTLEIEGQPPAGALATLNAQVIELFTAIAGVQRNQLQSAY
jgi:AcrR family transcriptional regulator